MSPVDYSQRRLNPMVDRYVTTDLPLEIILQDASTPRHPAVESLLYIQQCLGGKRLAKDAIAAAKAVPLDRVDPELLMLLLASWADLSCRIGRPSEARALLHRANGLMTEATHPEVTAAVHLVTSIAAEATGNKTEREHLLKIILQSLPPHSPRRKFYVWEMAMFLAQQGRAIEVNEDIKHLSWQCNESFRSVRVQLVYFVDAVETGNVAFAAHLMPQISSDLYQMKEHARIPWKYQALLLLMQDMATADGNGNVSTERPTRKSDPLQTAPTWLKVAYYLCHRQTDEALKLARLEASRLLGSIFGTGFDSFNLIRAELASGKWEGAVRLLKLRQARGNHHYLDPFFQARAELLAQNAHAAAQQFAQALKSVEFYRAEGRLDFELRMSCELSHGDLVQLTKSAQKTARREQRSATSFPARYQPEAPSQRPEPPTAHGTAVDLILGRSPAIATVRQTVLRFADIDAPVLITGQTGTGKELIARALHDSSRRRLSPFVAVDCGAIAETLLESELFGHERGAFTGADKASKGLFEEAGSGVIFLDEIGDISRRLQMALLRVLETGEIRPVGTAKTRKIQCRIIAATNADLDGLSQEGIFRRDLMYRLQRLEIHVLPLRERPEDILALTRHFLDLGRRVGVHATIAKDLQDALLSYEWPGNVRELRNVIERMRLLHSDKLLYTLDDLDSKLQTAVVPAAKSPAPNPVGPAASIDSASPVEPQPRDPSPASTTPTDIGGLLQEGRSQIRRLDRLRGLFEEHGKLTRSEVIQILSVSPNTATKDLKALCDADYIQRIAPSASTRSHYFILKGKSDNKTDSSLSK